MNVSKPRGPAETMAAEHSAVFAHLGGVPSRGAHIRTPGGGEGRYVGTTPDGIDWIAYSVDDYPTMRDAFRRLESSHPARFL